MNCGQPLGVVFGVKRAVILTILLTGSLVLEPALLEAATSKAAYTYHKSGRVKSVCVGGSCSEYLDESFGSGRGRLAAHTSSAGETAQYKYWDNPATGRPTNRMKSRSRYRNGRLIGRTNYYLSQRVSTIDIFGEDSSGRPYVAQVMTYQDKKDARPVTVDLKQIAVEQIKKIINPTRFDITATHSDDVNTYFGFELPGGPVYVYVNFANMMTGLRDFDQTLVLEMRRQASMRLVQKDGSGLAETHMDAVRINDVTLKQGAPVRPIGGSIWSGTYYETDIVTDSYLATVASPATPTIALAGKNFSLIRLSSRSTGADMIAAARLELQRIGLDMSKVISFSRVESTGNIALSFSETVWVEVDRIGTAVAVHFGEDMTLKDVLRQAKEILLPETGTIEILGTRVEGGSLSVLCGVKIHEGNNQYLVVSSIWMKIDLVTGAVEPDPVVVNAVNRARMDLLSRGVIQSASEAPCTACQAFVYEPKGYAKLNVKGLDFEYGYDSSRQEIRIQTITPKSEAAQHAYRELMQRINEQLNMERPVESNILDHGIQNNRVRIDYSLGEAHHEWSKSLRILFDPLTQIPSAEDPELYDHAGILRSQIAEKMNIDLHDIKTTRISGDTSDGDRNGVRMDFRTDRYAISLDWIYLWEEVSRMVTVEVIRQDENGNDFYDFVQMEIREPQWISRDSLTLFYDTQTNVEYVWATREAIQVKYGVNPADLSVSEWRQVDGRSMALTFSDLTGKTYSASVDLETGGIRIEDSLEDLIQRAKAQIFNIINPEFSEIRDGRILDDGTLDAVFSLPAWDLHVRLTPDDRLELDSYGDFNLIQGVQDARETLSIFFNDGVRDYINPVHINGIRMDARPYSKDSEMPQFEFSPPLTVNAEIGGFDVVLGYEANFFGGYAADQDLMPYPLPHQPMRVILSCVNRASGIDLAEAARKAALEKFNVNTKVVAGRIQDSGRLNLFLKDEFGMDYTADIDVMTGDIQINPGDVLRQRMEIAVREVAEALNADPANLGVKKVSRENGISTFEVDFKLGEAWLGSVIRVKDLNSIPVPGAIIDRSETGLMEVDPVIVEANVKLRLAMADSLNRSEGEVRTVAAVTQWRESLGEIAFDLETGDYFAHYVVHEETGEAVLDTFTCKGQDILNPAKEEANTYFGGKAFTLRDYHLVDDDSQVYFEFETEEGEIYGTIITLVSEFGLPMPIETIQAGDSGEDVESSGPDLVTVQAIADQQAVLDQQSVEMSDPRFAAPEDRNDPRFVAHMIS